MKHKLSSLLFFVVIAVTIISFQSCSNPKYTVWTDVESYAEFQKDFGTTLDDGYYKRVEISNSEWEDFAKNLSTKDANRWDEATIKKWLVANGFGETEATKESSWFALVKHGLLVSRNGNQVHFIVK